MQTIFDSSKTLRPSQTSSPQLLLKQGPSEPISEYVEKPAVWNRFLDFWTLGGASLLLLAFMILANPFRQDSLVLQQKFLMIAPLFGLLSIICNHPHFIITYRLAYSRGWNFVWRHWFTLVVVPIALISVFVLAFVFFDYAVPVEWFPANPLLGSELLSLSVWFMYMTVGWHYGKQVYGCMMVYGRYDNYHLSNFEKGLIRYSLLSLALFQFFWTSSQADHVDNFQDPRFVGINLASLNLPTWLTSASEFLAFLLFGAVVVIFIKNYLLNRQWPSVNFLVSWIAIYAWWVPVSNIPEYYYLAVPFFHSFQYLPFAYKMEAKKIPPTRHFYFQAGFRLTLLLLIGFLAFELVPSILDQATHTDIYKTPWFFMTAFAVFLNVHHFFMDSVIWRFEQSEVQRGLLKDSKTSPT